VHVRREIDRDERVVLLALRRRLIAALRRAPRPDLAAVLDAIDRAVAEARVDARRLNDARIARRGERAQAPGGPAPPPALAPHACHGEYLGDFADLAAVGRMAVETWLEEHARKDMSRGALAELALALHLRGALWTVTHAGRVHVFRCRAR
jgi:hypothetical protein